MFNKLTLTTFVVAAILMGLGYCDTAFAQISDAQIWDVQTPNNYSGGARANDGFFFGAEGLYWALPSPKSSTVGNDAVEGENAFNVGWTVRNNSTVYYIKKETDEDEDEDSEDEDEDGNNGDLNIGGGSDTSVSDLIKDGYDKVTDKEFLDYMADTYGPQGMNYMKQGNSWNTNLLDTKFHVGQRYSFGFMSGHNGWDCSIFTIDGTTDMSGNAIQLGLEDKNNNEIGSGYLSATIAGVELKTEWGNNDSYQDKDGNLVVDRMLVEFDTARMWNEINAWGVELNYLRRAHATRVGMFELGLGVRYMKWDEEFGFWGGSDRSGSGDIYAPNLLDDTSIETEADNNMVGPQIGLKWNRQTGRFGVEVLAKFTAAYNAQQVMNHSIIGSNGYANGIYGSEGIYGDIYVTDDNEEEAEKWQQYVQSGIGSKGASGYSKESFDVFTPIVELGVKFNFDLTRKIKFSLGWSGIFASNVARPAGMVDYTLDKSTASVMGLHAENHENNVFMHGFVFGLTLNR